MEEKENRYELTPGTGIERYFSKIESIISEIGKVIIGQDVAVKKLIVALLSSGHVLIEGVPGLAKTLLAKTIADIINCDFSRIQFTPDLLPADIIGTMIYNQKTGKFYAKKGPIFSSIILADEINRAPAKTQSALLEAMQERQVTIGETTFPLDSLFMVLATQNPIEQHGTYPLPEAQIDRFLMKIKMTYPNKDEELMILAKHGSGIPISAVPVIDKGDVLELQKLVHEVYMDKKIEEYIVDIVFATRYPEKYNIPEIKDMIYFGASPRASLALKITSKAYALINRRDFVTPDDIQELALDTLRHRIILSYEAQAEDIDPDIIIEKILDKVEVP